MTDADALHVPSSFDLQGHRGARGVLPENTTPAFLYAHELGVTTLEMDVVITADGQVVVSHEPWMNHAICTQPDGSPITEAEERSFNIYEMTYAEVTTFDCGSRGNPRFPDQIPQRVHKPLLREVIRRAEDATASSGRPPVLYNIETKSQPDGDDLFHPPPEEFTQLLLGVLEEMNVLDRAVVQSFDPRTLRVARRLQPDTELALLIASSLDAGLDANLDTLGFVPDLYSPDFNLVDATLVQEVHDRGMRLVPWTVNNVSDMRRLVELGVDGLITDYPHRAHLLLRIADEGS